MTLEEYRNQQHEIDLVVFHGIFKTQNAHGGRNVMPRCLSEGVDIFLKSVDRQGESGHDVRVSQAMLAWLVTLNLFSNTIQCHIIQCSPTVHIAFVPHTDGQGSVSYLDLRNDGILPVGIGGQHEGSSQLLAVYQRIQIHVSIIGQISALRERG